MRQPSASQPSRQVASLPPWWRGLRLQRRRTPSRALALAVPLLALAATLTLAAGLFAWRGQDPLAALQIFVLAPLSSPARLVELALKMTPLLLCALGLAVCYRSGVWNIGAEGQLVFGGLCAGAVALLATPASPPGFVGLVCLAGVLGGSLWAGITAWLRIRFNTSEILVSLMLTYVAQLLLLQAVHGPLRDPEGFQYPHSREFESAATLPLSVGSSLPGAGCLLAVLLALLLWLWLKGSRIGFALQAQGESAAAAGYAGFSQARLVALVLAISGGLAGLAGALEVAGPLGRLVPTISPGYGFAAIVVAWLARLHPLGCVVAAAVVAMIYVGSDLAQARLGLPAALAPSLQGLLLLMLLSLGALSQFQWVRVAPARRDWAGPGR